MKAVAGVLLLLFLCGWLYSCQADKFAKECEAVGGKSVFNGSFNVCVK